MTEKDIQDSLNYYEIAFVISPSLEEANASTVSKEIQAMVTKYGGRVVDGEEPRLRRLSFPMYKVINGQKIAATTGYFAWTKFEISSESGSEAAQSIGKELKSINELLRFLVVKTVKEKTYTPKAEPEPVEEVSSGEERPVEETGEFPSDPSSDYDATMSQEGEVVEEAKEE